MGDDGRLTLGSTRLAWRHRTSLALGFLALGGLLSFGTPAATQDAVPAPPPAEPPKIDITGFVDVYYLYNLNNKVDPALRSFDVQHNAFSLSLAEIAFAKRVTQHAVLVGLVYAFGGKV
jgi:hypothetical protein